MGQGYECPIAIKINFRLDALSIHVTLDVNGMIMFPKSVGIHLGSESHVLSASNLKLI